MTILHAWGATKPDQALTDLMLTKIAAFHFVRNPTLVFGFEWPNADGTHPDYDRECWHIRDDSTPQAGSRGLECCQALLEGLEEGYLLAKRAQPAPAPAKRSTKRSQPA